MSGEVEEIFPEKTKSVYVKSILQETEFIKRFTLAPTKGGNLSAFSPGSHITTYVRGDQGMLARAYSLTTHPEETQFYEIAVRLSVDSRGGSEYWHSHMKVGDELEISLPKNHFPLSHRAKHHVFYAAGIGITPFMSMMAELKESGKSFELHYAAKSKEACPFYVKIRGEFPEQSHFYFSKDSERLSVKSLLEHRIGTHVYFCGPETFISEFTDAAERYGYPKSSVHFERFTPPRPEFKNAFEIELTSGKKLQVEEDESILEALLREGIQTKYSCRVGRCGTCELKVIEGEIDHYDAFLTEEQRRAQNMILTCVSRAKSGKLLIEK